ncbi:MAG: GNAT family N-acetyltransferase [Candidatus Sulfotelmatobacter sp.]
MRHNVSLTCVRYRLRPVTVEDAPLIVALRTDSALSHFVHETSTRVEDQVAWLERYFDRADDYYFIVENVHSFEPQGTIGLYNVDLEQNSGEWGRWILKRGSMAALESAWLIYEVAFSRLSFDEVCSRTLAENHSVISFHDSFGALRSALLQKHFTLRGERKTAIEHRVTASEWPCLRDKHYSTIAKLASRIPSHWRSVPA